MLADSLTDSPDSVQSPRPVPNGDAGTDHLSSIRQSAHSGSSARRYRDGRQGPSPAYREEVCVEQGGSQRRATGEPFDPSTTGPLAAGLVPSGVVTVRTPGVALGLLALGVELFWVASRGVLPTALGLVRLATTAG